jgi:hypothetical protein
MLAPFPALVGEEAYQAFPRAEGFGKYRNHVGCHAPISRYDWAIDVLRKILCGKPDWKLSWDLCLTGNSIISKG